MCSSTSNLTPEQQCAKNNAIAQILWASIVRTSARIMPCASGHKTSSAAQPTFIKVNNKTGSLLCSLPDLKP